MSSPQHWAHSTQKGLLYGLMVCAALSIGMTAVFSAERTWTRSEVLAIADKEAARLGYAVEQMGVSFDIWNSNWNNHLESNVRVQMLDETSGQFRPQKADKLQETKRKLLKDLDGRDYWAVYYSLLKMGLGGDLWIFVDRNSGEVIKVIRGE